ncbi:hypothetical protein ACLB9X_22645 [Streptomyces sp. 5K101]|uniref:hypothetical protein n=1 Tax=Streptomyces sp. 5K101 TaxID=3390037 RepID=UPI003975DB47
MITGGDTVLVVCGPVPAAVERFLDRWSARWPQLRVASVDEDADAFAPWAPGVLQLGERSGHVLVARDEDMVAGWDDSGHVLDSRQEGPFSVAYEPAGRQSLKVMALEDPYVRTGFGYEPYEISLVGSGLYMITVVAPEEGPFGQAVVDALAACLGPAPVEGGTAR